MRKEKHLLSRLARGNLNAKSIKGKNILVVDRAFNGERMTAIMNFSNNREKLDGDSIDYSGIKLLDSAEEKWLGKETKMPNVIYSKTEYELSPYQFVLYEK